MLKANGMTSRQLREEVGLLESQLSKLTTGGCFSNLKRQGIGNGGRFVFEHVHIGEGIVAKGLLDNLTVSTPQIKEILGALCPDVLGSLAYEPTNKVLKVLIRQNRPIVAEIINLKEPGRVGLHHERIITPRPFTLEMLINLDPRRAYK